MYYEDLCSVKNPIVSVVTPSLNHGRFLRDTIESIATQTFREFEHIVIDGGSTDETCDILEEYPHIKWISEEDDDVLELLRDDQVLHAVRGDRGQSGEPHV